MANDTCKFEIGDVVHLKSGGPAMTIEDVWFGDDSREWFVRCSWFDERKKFQSDFNARALAIAPNES